MGDEKIMFFKNKKNEGKKEECYLKKIDRKIDKAILKLIEKDSFINFFKSLTWFGILYLIFNAIIISINNLFDKIPINNNILMNSYIIMGLLVLVIAIYICLIILIFIYQIKKVFQFTPIGKETTFFTSSYFFIIILFIAFMLTMLLRYFIQYYWHINFVIEFYIIISLILIIFISAAADYFILRYIKERTTYLRSSILTIILALYLISILAFNLSIFSKFNITK